MCDREAAALVASQAENRPDNATANSFVPSPAEVANFRSARDRYGRTPAQVNPLYRYVDGNDGLKQPSTGELVQWAAHKWGIPEDWVGAALTVESGWEMSMRGDREAVAPAWYRQYPPQAQVPGSDEVFESLGIAQVKWRPDGSVGLGTEPLRWKSTAFNLDYYAATVRYYYDGRCRWCKPGYGAGQAWNSIGAWFSPQPWNNADARAYVQRVQSARGP